MNRFFADTMLGQEREDSAAVKSQRLAERAVLSEFANAEQILAAAKEQGITAEKFFSSDGGIALPVLPVRTSDKFYIKKHTTSQRPYMHSHDFYEVIFVSRGRLRQTFSQGESLDMCKGECCIIVPPAAHKIERAGAGDIALKMVVPKNIFERCAGDFKDKLFAGGKKVSGGVYLYKNTEPRCAYFIFGLRRDARGAQNFAKYLQRAFSLCFLQVWQRVSEWNTAPYFPSLKGTFLRTSKTLR